MTKKFVTSCTSEKIGDLGPEIEISNLSQLETFTRVSPWSPYLFNRNHHVKSDGTPYKIFRNKPNFKGGHYFAIDIDKGMTLEDAVSKVKELNYTCFVNTSQNHRKNGNGDRYRIVFELSRPLTDASEVLGTFMHMLTHFPAMDAACKDETRFFKSSKDLIHIQETGVFLDPVKFIRQEPEKADLSMSDARLRLSLTTMNFFANPQPSGERHEGLVKACANAGQQGWTESQFRELFDLTINPWLAEEKHSTTVSDIFENRRWVGSPVVYGEQEQRLSGAIQTKWTLIWLKRHNVKSTYDGMLLINKKPVNRAIVLRDMRLDAASHNMNVSPSLFEDILDRFIEENRDSYLDSIKKQINKSSDSGAAELERFLRLMCGDNYKDTDLIAMKHFMWNVKRSMNGLETYRDLMPVFQGDQGIGKSETLRKGFLGPLNDLSKSTTFRQLDDGREMKLLSDNFVLLFDEMAHAGFSDIDNIKRMITESTISIRRMRETSHDIVKKNAQFIGTANKRLSTIINDPTGMRRFYEVVCRSKDSIEGDISEFYDKLNSLDYLSMWQSVSHKSDPPIKAHIAEFEEVQQEYISLHPIDDWLQESGEVEIKEGSETKAQDLLRNYNEYVVTQRITPYKFSKYLTESKFNDKIKKMRRADGVFYNIKLTNNSINKGEY